MKVVSNKQVVRNLSNVIQNISKSLIQDIQEAAKSEETLELFEEEGKTPDNIAMAWSNYEDTELIEKDTKILKILLLGFGISFEESGRLIKIFTHVCFEYPIISESDLKFVQRIRKITGATF